MIRPGLVALALLPCQLAAEPAAIRPADLERLARFDEAAGGALLQALRDGSADDLAALEEALDGSPVAPNPAGDWTCRTVKAGGAVALVAYAPFRCRIIRIGPTEWEFEKLTGSQRSWHDRLPRRPGDLPRRRLCWRRAGDSLRRPSPVPGSCRADPDPSADRGVRASLGQRSAADVSLSDS